MKTNFNVLSDSLIFSVTRRSRSDVSHLPREWSFALTWLMWPLWAGIPLEDFKSTDEDDDDHDDHDENYDFDDIE